MKKDSLPFCYFLENSTVTPAILHECQLIEAVLIFII